jgi:hypothetical protein
MYWNKTKFTIIIYIATHVYLLMSINNLPQRYNLNCCIGSRRGGGLDGTHSNYEIYLPDTVICVGYSKAA